MNDLTREKAYLKIRRKMVSGELFAGSRISELSLTRELGISRGPVREALVQLASEGLIAHEPGSGSFVRRPQRDDLEDLFEFREWVEARAAKEAARRKISREVAARIQDACDAARKFAKVIKEAESESFDDDLKQQWFACEANFHLNIIQIVGNRLLNRIMASHHLLHKLWWHSFDERTYQNAEIIYATARGCLESDSAGRWTIGLSVHAKSPPR